LSFYPVSKRKEKQLLDRMAAVGCRENDLQEEFLRGGGVAIMHHPTGIRIRCIKERRQRLNRFFARRLLVEELEARRENKTRHELKAERLSLEKKRKPKALIKDGFAQFQLRAKHPELPGGVPKSISKALGRLGESRINGGSGGSGFSGGR
jgi:hypothetical protein